MIMYADKVTDSMKKAIEETERRRKLQEEFNHQNKITPTSIKKEIRLGIEQWRKAEEWVGEVVGETQEDHAVRSYIAYLYERMMRFSSMLDFERAARLRDEIKKLEAEHGLQKESRLKPSKH